MVDTQSCHQLTCFRIKQIPIFTKCNKRGKYLKIFGGSAYFTKNLILEIGDNFKMQGLANIEARTDNGGGTPNLIVGDDVSPGLRNVISVGKKMIGYRMLTAPEVRIRDKDGRPLDPE